uniref:Uncharacterized protein n=1 Tax=Romanomermis culicivorax TaxID=13658 RepID=A0A915IGD0_ROMCU
MVCLILIPLPGRVSRILLNTAPRERSHKSVNKWQLHASPYGSIGDSNSAHQRPYGSINVSNYTHFRHYSTSQNMLKNHWTINHPPSPLPGRLTSTDMLH